MSNQAENNSQSSHLSGQTCEKTQSNVGDEVQSKGSTVRAHDGKEAPHSRDTRSGDGDPKLIQGDEICTVISEEASAQPDPCRRIGRVGAFKEDQPRDFHPHREITEEGFLRGELENNRNPNVDDSEGGIFSRTTTDFASTTLDDQDTNLNGLGKDSSGISHAKRLSKCQESLAIRPISLGSPINEQCDSEAVRDCRDEKSECIVASAGETQGGLVDAATTREGHVSTERTSTDTGSSKRAEDRARKASKGFKSAVSPPKEPKSASERLFQRRGNRSLCLPKRPDALELNLTCFAWKECQENHHQHQPGRGGGYSGLDTQPSFANSCEYQLNSLECKQTGIGSASPDQTFNYSTPAESIGICSGVDKKLDRQELASSAEGIGLDCEENRQDEFPKFRERVRGYSGSFKSERHHAESGFSHDSDTCTYVKQRAFCLIAGGQNFDSGKVTEGNVCGSNDTNLSRHTLALDNLGVLDTNALAEAANSSVKQQHYRLRSEKSALKPSGIDEDKWYDSYGSTESHGRRRKLSCAGLRKQCFYRRNIEGIPRCRSLSPLTLRRPRDIFNTKHICDKIQLSAESHDAELAYHKDFSRPDEQHAWSYELTDLSRMDGTNSDIMASEKRPQLGRSYSFRSSTLGRIRKKRSHSLESAKSVEDSLGLVTAERPQPIATDVEQDKSNTAGVRAKPKLPSFQDLEVDTGVKGDPDMEELKKMLDVLKVDFVRKYSRDPRGTPGTSSPVSGRVSPRSSPSSCQSSLSDLQARLNSIKLLTNKLRVKHGGPPLADSPTKEVPLHGIGDETAITKSKSVDDIPEEEQQEEMPIRRTRSARDQEIKEEPLNSPDLSENLDAELSLVTAGRRDGHAPRDRPGSPFQTALSESFEQADPGGPPFRISTSPSILLPGDLYPDSSLNEIAAQPRFRRVKDTSVFTKQTVVHRKVSPGAGGGLQRQISVESTGVQSEHEECLPQVESNDDGETKTGGCNTRDINVQVLDSDANLDKDSLQDVSQDTASSISDLSSVGAGERKSGEYTCTTVISDSVGDISERAQAIDRRPEYRLSSEDEGLGITESDASTENVSRESGVGKGGISWSNWTEVIRPKAKVQNVSIAEQFNMIAKQKLAQAEEMEGEDTDPEATPECQRTPRKSRRTVTHPTFSSANHPMRGEVGSLDSNGLGSLLHRPFLGVSSSAGDLSRTRCDVPLVDIGIAPTSKESSDSEQPTYVVTSEPFDSEKTDKKCTKSPKTKSKSDPMQQKGTEFEFPMVISAAHALSSPSISYQERPTSPELIITEGKCAKKSLSDNFLALHDNAEASGDSASESADTYKVPIFDHRTKGKPPVGPTPIPAPRRVSKKQRAKSNVEIPQGDKERHLGTTGTCSDDDSGVSGSRITGRSNTAPNTPNTQSPTGSLDRKASRLSPTGSLDRRTSNTLSLSGPGRAVVGRSKSSASVFANAVKKKQKSGNGSTSSGDITDADLARKQSFDSKISPGVSDPDLLNPTRLSTCSAGSGDGDQWNRTSPCATPPRDRSPPLAFRLDKRFHVVQELYNVEKEYVETLRVLVEKYMIPLKSSSIIDSTLVDDIFYKVPEILNHHAIFLDFLERAFLNWDENQTVGQHIRNTFSKESVVDSYVSFIENYKTSERVLENLLNNKTSFQKFIEQCQRENRRKLPLKALIIQPAQRIPRYELLLRRLIEHTPKEHQDHHLLLEAESAIHELALKINTVKETKQEEIMQESLKQLEMLLMTDLSVPERMYIKHDMVTVMSRKDQCCLWLFSDLLLISAIKRKSGTVKKASIRLQSPSGQDFVDNVKHKVWLRIGLDDVDIIKTGSLTRKSTVDKEELEDNFSLLGQILELTNRLTCSHQVLEETIRDMMSSLQRQLSEQQGRAQELTKLDLMTTTQEGVNIIGVLFPTIDKRLQWEALFAEAKLRLASSTDRKPPDFLQSLPITKTRAGMQFSCAAPIDGLNANNYRDVWVCNSDGHVGHMCLLSLEPEPIVTLNTPVPGCNSRILCVCAVPAQALPFKRIGSCKGCRRKSCMIHTPTSPVKLEPDSSSSSDDDSSSSDDDEFGDGAEADVKSSDDDEKGCKSGALYDPYKSTMWLGTEDGFIMIFQCTDNIKTTRNKLRIQHAASVLSIVYLDNKVFVSLANGDLIIYRRLPEGTWNTDKPETKGVGTSTTPVNRMLVVAGKLWCGCHREMVVLNPATLQVERSFLLPSDSDRPVHCMACSSKGVWIAIQNSSKVALFNATSCDFLVEVNVAQIVAQKLATADDIIRQHKTACLRITALMACKDLLWVGTSAGIILTVALPIISTTTTRNNIQMPNVTALVHGHTGHVRFLTCVEMPANSHQGDAAMLSRRASMTPAATTMATKMLVISGGDGYEDFRGNPNEDEMTGKDDSTNHLLLWQV
ncbi:uncharacterized protein LOC135493544 [Lineus longissimus]|uniref:uncharacterized protein LOC135493544 n=1 Tax=Lineus longissimus TaxID=88925 RepID=UPI002B4F4227